MVLQHYGDDLSHLKSAVDRVRELALLASKNGEPFDNDDKSTFRLSVIHNASMLALSVMSAKP